MGMWALQSIRSARYGILHGESCRRQAYHRDWKDFFPFTANKKHRTKGVCVVITLNTNSIQIVIFDSLFKFPKTSVLLTLGKHSIQILAHFAGLLSIGSSNRRENMLVMGACSISTLSTFTEFDCPLTIVLIIPSCL